MNAEHNVTLWGILSTLPYGYKVCVHDWLFGHLLYRGDVAHYLDKGTSALNDLRVMHIDFSMTAGVVYIQVEADTMKHEKVRGTTIYEE